MRLLDFKWDVDNCNRCSMCKWVNPWEVSSSRFSRICPAVSRYLFDSYSAQGKLDIAMAVMERGIEHEWKETIASITYHCMLCGACDVMCKRSRDIEPLGVLLALREAIWDEGLAPAEVRALGKNIQESGNPWGKSGAAGPQWREGLAFAEAEEGAEVLFFPGCAFSLEPELQGVARDMAAMLLDAGVKMAAMDETCCCGPLLDAGDRAGFEEAALENLERLNRSGAGKVVVPCADCYHTLKVEYARVAHERGMSVDFEVFHVCEFMEGLLQEGALGPFQSADMKVTYHDPCRLARLGDPYIPWEGTRGAYGETTPPKTLRRGDKGVYDPPRRLLTSVPGLELVEMERNRENAWCCGSGPLLRSYDPGFAGWSAKKRIEEALQTGAEALVTACPWCVANLKEAAGERIAVRYLTELFTGSMES